MNREQTVRGFRVLGDRKPERELSYEYLKLGHEATLAQDALRDSVRKNGANCVGREDEFSGDRLMSDRDAQLECAGCPSFTACDLFRKVAHPAWGVFAGHVKGRGLMEDLEKDWEEA